MLAMSGMWASSIHLTALCDAPVRRWADRSGRNCGKELGSPTQCTLLNALSSVHVRQPPHVLTADRDVRFHPQASSPVDECRTMLPPLRTTRLPAPSRPRPPRGARRRLRTRALCAALLAALVVSCAGASDEVIGHVGLAFATAGTACAQYGEGQLCVGNPCASAACPACTKCKVRRPCRAAQLSKLSSPHAVRRTARR
jgi:hypothetical protein